MKLIYITNGITGSGGLERVLSVKASGLAENFGYEVHLLSLNEIGKEPFFCFSEKVLHHSIVVTGNPIHYFLQYKHGIQKVLDEIQPDIISVCDDALKGFFLPHMIKSKAKWIHENHASMLLNDKGTGVPFNKKIQHAVKQVLGKRFSNVILLTEGNRKEWHLDNIEVIPNPAPFKIKEFSNHQNKKIIAVGSYSFNKGYDVLLKIWSKINENYVDWELNIYGRNTKQNLKTEAEKLNLKNINFFSSVPNIESKYLESSIMVLTSRSEGFGMVLIEAMSCGLPVISFDCPHGPRDIISDGKDGFLIEKGNVELFAEKLEMLIINENLRKHMGKLGKENSQRYNREEIVKKWDALFKSLEI